MKSLFKNQRGFSLIEMMLVIAISTFMAYAMFAVMRAGDEQIQGTQTKMAIQDSAREGMYKMSQEIRMSAPDRISITGGNVIQFQIPDPANRVDEAFSINWDNAHTIRYQQGGLNNTQLIRTNVTTGSSSVLANDVTGIAFAGNGANPSVVTMTLSVQRVLANGRLTPAAPLQVSGQAEIRNL